MSKKLNIEKENLEFFLSRLRDLVSKTSGTVQLSKVAYIHAFAHVGDSISRAAGLEAGAYLDKEKASVSSPIDCLLSVLVVWYGLEVLDEVLEWDIETLQARVEAVDTAELERKAEGINKHREQEMLSEIKKLVGPGFEDQMMSRALAALPEESTKH